MESIANNPVHWNSLKFMVSRLPVFASSDLLALGMSICLIFRSLNPYFTVCFLL